MGETIKLESTPMTMEDIYTAIMERDPNAIASIHFDEEGKPHPRTYDNTRNRVFETASKLSHLLSGTAPKTIVGLKIKNAPRWPVFFWALLMSGHIPLLIDARLPRENTDNLLKQAKAVALICNDDENFCVPKLKTTEVIEQNVDYTFNPRWADNVIFCSSGTTGDAKMMVFSGRNLCAQITASLSIPDKTVDLMYPSPIRNLAMLPFHHIFGFVAVYLWFTFYGKTIVYPKSLATSDLLYACQKGKCTHVFSVPMFWDSVAQTVNRTVANLKPSRSDLISRMIAYNTHKVSKREAGLSSRGFVRRAFQKKVLGKYVRYCISGGGFLSPKTQALINGLGYNLYNGFGMTELGVTSVDQSPRVEHRMRGSIGQPFRGIEYKIDLKEGETQGELMVRSAITHEEEIIGGVRRKTPLEDGFFRTGDIAVKDKNGNFYLKGRIKDTIILSNGENVFPDEIEYYFKNVSGLHNCVCLGAKSKDDDEEKITLVCEVDNNIDEEGLKRLYDDLKAINDTLASEKKVQRFLLDKHPLPMSSSMKVKRFVVKKAIEEGTGDFVGQESEQKKPTVSFEGYDPKEVEETLKGVIKVFSKILLLPEFKIEPDAIWNADLGGDSMAYIEMCQALDKEFKITIPESLYGILGTANDFTKQILDIKAEEREAKSK